MGGLSKVLELVYTVVGSLVAVMAGVRSTHSPSSVSTSARTATSLRKGYRVVWDPSRAELERTPGPLVYLVRQWDGDTPTAYVKIGYTKSSRPGAASGRTGDWETGTLYPIRVEGLVLQAPPSLERALHRAVGAEHERTSTRREWFEVDRDDPSLRPIVEATAALHKETAADREALK